MNELQNYDDTMFWIGIALGVLIMSLGMNISLWIIKDRLTLYQTMLSESKFIINTLEETESIMKDFCINELPQTFAVSLLNRRHQKFENIRKLHEKDLVKFKKNKSFQKHIESLDELINSVARCKNFVEDTEVNEDSIRLTLNSLQEQLKYYHGLLPDNSLI